MRCWPKVATTSETVVDAVACAVEVQRELAEHNEELPEERRMRFRIGVNLGDVLVARATFMAMASTWLLGWNPWLTPGA